jgi:hypothetical protein
MGRSAVDPAPALPRFGSRPCHRVRAQERGALRRSDCGSERHHEAVERHDQDLVLDALQSSGADDAQDRQLGFGGGEVIEPGCGAGVFIGLAPDSAQMIGVELDGATAAIAEQLYPHAMIINRSFAEPARGLRDGRFAMAIGNVPFADVALCDPRHNRGGHALHNHFIIKSLALVQPGGLAVLLTSRFTLDAGNPAARREISQLADLLGAMRLPSGAHRRVAGTEAITDLLVFRRREPGSEAADESWLRTREVQVAGATARINEHFAEHPDRVLGELQHAHGLYRNDGEGGARRRDGVGGADQPPHAGGPQRVGNQPQACG